MASIHKDPRGRSPYYYAAYTLANGKRRFRSTKKTKERDAWKVCLALEGAAREAGTTNRDLKILNEMRDARGRKPVLLPSIRDYLNGWLESQRPPILSPSTHKRYTSSIQKFVKFLGDEADTELQSLTAEQIEAFIAHEKKAGLAPKSLNLDLKAIRAALGKAFKRGHVVINVASTVDTQTNSSVTKKAFTIGEIRKLLETATDDEWYGLIYSGYYTGLRFGDLSRLRWDNIDLQKKRITIVPDKRFAKRIRPPLEEPIHPQLLIWLKLWKADEKSQAGNAFVFPTLSQKPIERDKGLSNTFSRLIETAGIENPEIREKVKGSKRSRAVKAYGFHSLRRSFNTQLEAAGVSEEVRMKLSDHTSPEVNKLYTKPEWERLSVEISKLPKL